MLESARRPNFGDSPLGRLAVAVLLAGLLVAPVSAAIHVYENASGSGSAITPAASNPACLTGGLAVTFVVPASDSYAINDVALGFSATHSDRDQIRAILIHPNGTTQQVVLTQGGGGTVANYDVMLTAATDPSGTTQNDGDTDPQAEPFYHRMVTVAGLGSTFDGLAANGTWTLRVCDRVSDATNGTFTRGRLVLSDSSGASQVCSNTLSLEWCGSAACDGSPFPLAGLATGGVTLTQNSQSATPAGAGATADNFELQDEQLGAENGYFFMNFNDSNGSPNNESIRFFTSWQFSVPVRDLTWRILDNDRSTSGDWEDLSRSRGTYLGAASPLVVALGASQERAGDFVEADGENYDTNQAGANIGFQFNESVATLEFEYWAGDDFVPSENQYTGFGNPTFCAFDFGDAPDTFGTLLTNNGARHVLARRDLYLGAIPPDGEIEGRPSADASDDNDLAPNIQGDEDGITTFPDYTQGSGTYTLSVRATNNSGVDANLRGFIDWDGDGTFNLAYDRSANVVVPTGSNNTSFDVTWSGVPAVPTASAKFARFRIATSAGEVASPTGLANSGEVEDYQIAEGTLPVTLAWVASTNERGGVGVRFMTATETRNAGFRLWGLDEKGNRSLLGQIRSKRPDSFAPQSYEAFYPGHWSAIEIEDVSASGRNRLHGPFPVGETAGQQPEVAAIDWAAIRSENAQAEAEALESARPAAADLLSDARVAGPAAMALVQVREPGIHRLTFEQLLAAGLDLSNTRTARLALYDRGKRVPVYRSGNGLFGPGAYLEFLFQPSLTLESPFDALELRVERRDLGNVPPAPAGAGEPAITEAVLERFDDNRYSSSAPIDDPWHDAQLLAFGSPAQLSRTFDLPDLADGSVTLTLRGWGYSYSDGASPDHHVVVRLNGTELASETFDGLTPWEATFEVSGLVEAADNTLELVVPGDTGYLVDLFVFEGFSVAYRRETVAIDGRFRGRPVNGGAAAYAVDGLADGPVTVWLQGPQGTARRGTTASGGRVAVPSGQFEAWVAQSDRVLTPEVSVGVPLPLASKGADYLIVTHPVFAGSLGDLVALQQSRGFSTAVVRVDQIYAAYSDHQPSAEAIRQFIAASSGSGRPKYVLLVGAASSDPYDHLGLGSISFVPTAYLPVVTDVSFSPTDEAIADIDGDQFPDVPIGRLPVRTIAEVENAIDKLYAWENQAVGAPHALLVAGASDGQGELSSINEGYSLALGGWSSALAQVDDLGTATVRQQTVAGMNAGVPLVSFVGHSSPSQWDFTPILHWSDVDALTNSGRPNLVTQWGCWNSYYVEPNYECMSGRLMRASGVGAAGTIGAATLTSDASHRRLGVLFFEQLAGGQPRRLGDVFLAAKRALRTEGGAQDAILGMALLGDPAMPLPTVTPTP